MGRRAGLASKQGAGSEDKAGLGGKSADNQLEARYFRCMGRDPQIAKGQPDRGHTPRLRKEGGCIGSGVRARRIPWFFAVIRRV
jgi:hypothetical protein